MARIDIEKHIKFALVVSNNPGLRNDLQAKLTALDIETMKITSPQQAYEEIAKARVRCDMVICDALMGADKISEFVATVTANPRFKNLMLVAVMEKGQVDVIRSACSQKIHGFMVKPFAVEKMITYIEYLVSIYEKYQNSVGVLAQMCEAKFEIENKGYYPAITIYENIIARKETAPVCFELGKAYRMVDCHLPASVMLNKAIALDSSLMDPVMLFMKEFPIDKNKTTGVYTPLTIPKAAIDAFGMPVTALRPMYGVSRVKSVLLAMANADERRIVKEILESHGATEIEQVTSAAEIRSKARGRVIDLVMMDLTLPDGDGIDLTMWLRGIHHQGAMAIYCCYSEGMYELVVPGINAGMTGICMRPLTKAGLVAAMDQGAVCLDLARLSDGAAEHLRAAWLYYFDNQMEPFFNCLRQAVVSAGDDPMVLITKAMAMDYKREREAADQTYSLAINRNAALESMVAHLKKRIDLQITREIEAEKKVNKTQQDKEREEKVRQDHRQREEAINESRRAKVQKEEQRLDENRTKRRQTSEQVVADVNPIPRLPSDFEAKRNLAVEKSKEPIDDDANIIDTSSLNAGATPSQVVVEESTHEDLFESVEIIPDDSVSIDIAQQDEIEVIADDVVIDQLLNEQFEPTYREKDAPTPLQKTKKIGQRNPEQKEYVYDLKQFIDNPHQREKSLSAEIVEWIKPEKLAEYVATENRTEIDYKRAKILAQQAMLFSGRMIALKSALPDNHEFDEYVMAIGREITKIADDISLDMFDELTRDKINSIINKLRKNPDSQKLLMQLGFLCVDKGLVDALFKQTSTLEEGADLSAAPITDVFADSIKHLSGDSDVLVNYFAGIRQQLIDASLQADGGKAVLRSFLDVLGVKPFMKMVADEAVADAFFADMRSQKIARLFAKTLRDNPKAIDFLQQQLPGHVDLVKSILAEDGSVQNIFDLIVDNRAQKAFFSMIEDFNLGGALTSAAFSEGSSLSFMEFLLKNSAVVNDQQMASGAFDMPLLGHMVRGGYGSEALEGLFSNGGVRVIEDIIRSGGGVRIIDQVISSPWADLLLQRLIKENSLGSFMAKATQSKSAVRLLRSFIGPDNSLEDAIARDNGKYIINDIIERGQSSKLLKAVLKGEGAEALAFDVFSGNDTRQVLFEMLHEEAQQQQEMRVGERAVATAVLSMEEPIRNLHQSMWEGKQESTQKLEQAETKDAEDDEGESLLAEMNAILERDHYAIQSFKKGYKLLLERGLDERAAEFFEANYQAYLSHDGLRDSLYEFMKSMPQDSFDLTLKLLGQAHKQNKNNYFYVKELAALALKAGNYDEVRMWVKKMIKINPDLGESYNILAISFKRQGKFKKAIKWYQRGIAHDDLNVKLHYNLAIVYALVGESRASSQALKRSQQLKNEEQKAA